MHHSNFIRLKVWTANTNYADPATDMPWFHTITATFEENEASHTMLAVAKMIRGLVGMYRGDEIMVWVDFWNSEGQDAGWDILKGFQGRVDKDGEEHLNWIADIVENGKW